MTELVERGKRTKVPKLSSAKLFVFEGEQAEFGGFFGERGTIKLDESKSPKLIDIILEPRTVGQKESGKKRVTLGIYELEGDCLRIAFPERESDPRPTKLEASYIVLQRRVIKGDLELLNGEWKLPEIRSIRGNGTTNVSLRIDAVRNRLTVTIREYANARGFDGQRTLLTLEGINDTDAERFVEVAEYKGNSPTARVAYKVEKDRLRLQGKVQLDALRFIDLSGEWEKK